MSETNIPDWIVRAAFNDNNCKWIGGHPCDVGFPATKRRTECRGVSIVSPSETEVLHHAAAHIAAAFDETGLVEAVKKRRGGHSPICAAYRRPGYREIDDPNKCNCGEQAMATALKRATEGGGT